jgi:hypothetical protein
LVAQPIWALWDLIWNITINISMGYDRPGLV